MNHSSKIYHKPGNEKMLSEILTNEDIITKCRKEYPIIMDEYEKIEKEQKELFATKMLDYGKTNISVNSSLDTEEEIVVSLSGLWFRINDKISRLKNLILLRKKPYVKSESVKDTFQDLSIYGIISQIVIRNKWK